MVRTSANGDLHHVAVIGFPGDVGRVEMLVTSLMVQMATAMLAESPAGVSASATASWRRSFISAYANRIGARLRAARHTETTREDATAPAGDGPPAAGAPGRPASTEMVLADRDAVVEAEMRRIFGRLRTTYISAGNSPRGSAAGTAAGDRANLGGATVGGPRGTLGR